MKIAYIGIGSNMGKSQGNCREAIETIGALDECSIISVSGFYLTEPVGVEAQDWYVNSVVSMSTAMPAQDLLKTLLQVEKDMGRVRIEKWGPRIIDLDLLLYGDELLDDEGIKVPHPLMHLRKFVMAPMTELAPELIHPALGKTMAELYGEIEGESQVIKRLEEV
jgi:2-amino-4-hydroxy-6-hydroxymethyldihydropteridine diphosphokinase